MEYFYRQRALIEKEYSKKLQALCNESFRRKSKISSTVSVGDEPNLSAGSNESSTLGMWTEILNKNESIAKEKLKFSNELNDNISNKMSNFQKRCDMYEKKYADLYALAVKEKSNMEMGLKKSKSSYYSACEGIEQVRVKNEKKSNGGNTKKYSEKEIRKNISKNNYLIKINQLNRLKDKYFFQDLPEILDGLQDLNEAKTIELNRVLQEVIEIETKQNNQSNELLGSLSDIIKKNEAVNDTVMFIKHNVQQWTEPSDFKFENSPIWYDDDQMIIDGEDEMRDLRKRLAAANNDFLNNDKICEGLQMKISDANKVKSEMKQSGMVLENLKCFDDCISTLRNFIINDNLRVAAEVEMQIIQSSAGDHDLTLKATDEKKKRRGFGSIFRKTQHGDSKQNDVKSIVSGGSTHSAALHRLGGLHLGSKLGHHPGKDVSAGNQSVYSGVSNASGSNVSAEQSAPAASVSRASSSSTSFASNAVQATPMTTQRTINQGVASYAYQKSDADETSIQANEVFEVLAFDDGSGWTQIRKSNGETGLVPTSYIAISQVNVTEPRKAKKSSVPPKVAPPRKSGKNIGKPQATVLYDYAADGDDEISISAGESVTILEEDDGSGWTLGEVKGRKGLFPTSYVQTL